MTWGPSLEWTIGIQSAGPETRITKCNDDEFCLLALRHMRRYRRLELLCASEFFLSVSVDRSAVAPPQGGDLAVERPIRNQSHYFVRVRSCGTWAERNT